MFESGVNWLELRLVVADQKMQSVLKLLEPDLLSADLFVKLTA
jgi:hypothetical protein